MLNKAQTISKNNAKYGWRYEALDEWLNKGHPIPQSEKSTFSQLKARTLVFGESLAKRLSKQYGIVEICIDLNKKDQPLNDFTPQECELPKVFRSLSCASIQSEVISFSTFKLQTKNAIGTSQP